MIAQRFFSRLTVLAVAFAALLIAAPARAEESGVGTALVLLVDVSGSVDDKEYALQRDGIARAFRDPAVVKAIWNQPYGTMAVTAVEWSDTQRVVVPWMLVSDAASAERFARAVAAVTRTSAGGTHIGDAIIFALELRDSCGCAAARFVFDISGDGRSNGGRVSVDAAREIAIGAGVTINGLPIVDDTEPDLATHYREHVAGGVGSFVIEANGFEDFARAIRQKLVLEIADARDWGALIR